MTLFMSGCAETVSQPSDSRSSTSEHQLGSPPDTLGEGVKTTVDGDDNIGLTGTQRCVPGHVETDDNLRQVNVSAFYTYRRSDAKRRVEASLDADVSAGFSANVSSEVKKLYGSSTIRRKLIVIAQVITKEKNWVRGAREEDDEEITPSACTGGELDESSKGWFIDKCGQRYVDELTYGGHVIFSMDQTNFSREERLAIESKIGASAGPANVELEGVLDKMNSDTKITHSFETKTVGKNMPSVPADFSDGITADEWGDYKKDLKDYNGGIPISRTEAGYQLSDYDNCGTQIETDVNAAKQCYQSHAASVTNYLQTNSGLVRQARRVEQMVENPQQVDWGSNPGNNEEKYTGWLNDYEACTQSDDGAQVAESMTQCEENFKAGNYDALCSVCSTPDSCDPTSLIERLESYQTARIREPDSVETAPPNNENSYEEPSKEFFLNGASDAYVGDAGELCFLTRVSGGFGGAGERIALEYKKVGETDPDEGEEVEPKPIMKWVLNVNSQRTDQEHKIGATVRCTKKSNFFGTDGSAEWYRPNTTSVETSSGAKKYTEVPGAPEINAISGISGKMSGRAEDATFDSHPDKNILRGLRVKSNQGWLKAWSTSFGLKNPLNMENGTELTRLETAKQINSPRNRSKSLIPHDKGICFLTHVGGELDGTGEKVDIYKSGDNWVVKVRGVCQKGTSGGAFKCRGWKEVEGQARCIYYNQNDI